ncbi:MAG: Trimethylamine methyltransferase MttB [Methanomethylovorans sp. PtaU1.Bin093]|nr:MAG: Trimethylamine methyltransferase MttB [Methanomethylovorans sp. PtaU1.Bin093]
MIYGAGMLELGMTFSLEQLVMDNDFISMIMKSRDGVPVTDETLAYKAIKDTGFGGHFLAHKTTLKNVNLPSHPSIINRQMYGDWERAGSKDIASAAHDKVVYILQSHQVKPIDADILTEMKAIVAKVDKMVAGK